MRFDPYLNVDEGWDDSTEELVTELFKLTGDASRTLAEMHYRIAILWSKVRPETFIKVINAIPLPNTDLTVIQRAEPELGENLRPHARPAKLNGTDIHIKLLGTLVHWLMHNNLSTKLNTYSAKQAIKDFDVSYTKLKRVISGVWQHGGSYYDRLHQEQEEGEAKKSNKKHKAVNLVDAALAKKRKVTLSADTAECKYYGKSYRSGKKLTEHINKQHTGAQTIYVCPYCSQPFNQYSEYLEHLGKHKDKVIRCRLCNKEFKTITKLRKHTKSHVNQCPLCSMNFLTPQALQDHMKESHGSKPATEERQCSLCEFTCNSMSELAEHSQSVHHPYSCNICFLCFSAEYKLVDHRLAEHKISSLGASVEVGDQGDQALELPQPENIGAAQQVEPTREERNQGNQASEPPAPQEEPESREPEVPTGSKDHQVEVDKVKGSEVRTEEYDRECDACHRFFSSNM